MSTGGARELVAIPKTRWRLVELANARFDTIAPGIIVALSAVLVAFFLIQENKIVGSLGMPLDDAWIHFRIAENLAAGLGFSFNPGEPTSASTSPAWTLLLSATYLITGQFLVPALALGIAFFLLTNVAIYYLALLAKPDRWLALLAAVFCATTGRWLWAGLSGMETPMFTALSVWGILLYALGRKDYRWSPDVGVGLLALSALVRPEGYLLLGLVVLDRMLPFVRQARKRVANSESGPTGRVSLAIHYSLLTLKSISAAAPVPVLILVVSLMVRVAYTMGTGGGLAGNTFLAQSLPQGDGPYTGPRLLPDIWYLRSAVRSLTTDSFLLGLFIPLGVVAWIRTGFTEPRNRSLMAIVLLWFIGLPLVNSVMAPNLRHHERYLMPLIPFAALLGTFGIDLAVNQIAAVLPRVKAKLLGQPLGALHIFAVVTIFCLGDALFESRRWSIQYSGDVRSIQAINVKLGEWLRDNTPRGAYVAMNDIGAIAFISDRRVLDTVGIAEPGILPYISQLGREGVYSYLQQKRPDYLVIWPEWYPEMAAKSDVFKPLYSARMDNPLKSTRESMLGGREMVVYKAHWP